MVILFFPRTPPQRRLDGQSLALLGFALPATQRQPVMLGWRAKSSTIVQSPMVRITAVIRGIERSEIPLDGRVKEEDPCSGGALPRPVEHRGGVRRSGGCPLRGAE